MPVCVARKSRKGAGDGVERVAPPPWYAIPLAPPIEKLAMLHCGQTEASSALDVMTGGSESRLRVQAFVNVAVLKAIEDNVDPWKAVVRYGAILATDTAVVKRAKGRGRA